MTTADPHAGAPDAALQARPATAERILDVAARLVQLRGFNGFSYADIAAELAITNAAVHYHFKSKEDLGLNLVERYSKEFLGALNAIREKRADSVSQLDRYVQLYEDVAAGGRMCLCGMLIAEIDTMPASISERLSAIMETNENWLAQTLEQGRARGELAFPGEAGPTAAALAALLQGALLLAKTRGGAEQFRSTAAAGVEALYVKTTPR